MYHRDIRELMYENWSSSGEETKQRPLADDFYRKYVKGDKQLEMEADFNAALIENEFVVFSAGVDYGIRVLRDLGIIAV